MVGGVSGGVGVGESKGESISLLSLWSREITLSFTSPKKYFFYINDKQKTVATVVFFKKKTTAGRRERPLRQN